jgi:hypothetical protein
MLSKKYYDPTAERPTLVASTEPSVGTYSSTQNTLTNFFRKNPKAKKSDEPRRLTKDFANKTAGDGWSPWKSKAQGKRTQSTDYKKNRVTENAVNGEIPQSGNFVFDDQDLDEDHPGIFCIF